MPEAQKTGPARSADLPAHPRSCNKEKFMQRQSTRSQPAGQEARNGTSHGKPEGEVEPIPLQFLEADQATARKKTWLWEGRIPANTVTFLQGTKGCGKSTWLRHIAAMVSGGPKLPGQRSKTRHPGHILWFAGEEEGDGTVLRGLRDLGAVLSRCKIQDLYTSEVAAAIALPRDLKRLEAAVRHYHAALVVLDPVFSFCDGTVSLEGPSIEARAFMLPLIGLARRESCTILLSRNCTKDRSASALDSGRGSGELGNAARAVIHLAEVADDRGTFGLASAGLNEGAKPLTLLYQLEPVGDSVRAVAKGTVSTSADDLAQSDCDAAERDALGDAKRLLRRILSDGWISATDVRREAANALLSDSTLRRAKASLAVPSRRRKGEIASWEWGPPVGGW
jgi:hypothetical protein